jgi:methionine aminotransferase
MSALAKEHNAINLSQGFPDYPISNELMDSVTQAMKDGFNQYAPMIGLPELRNALATKIQKLYQANINPDTEITITPGGTYSIYTSLTTILEAGDEVIVLEPAYDSYIPITKDMLIDLQSDGFYEPYDGEELSSEVLDSDWTDDYIDNIRVI